MKPTDMNSSFVRPTIAEIRADITSGRSSAESWIARSFAAAQASQSTLHAFQYLPEEQPLAPVDESLPLAGVCVAVKDIIDTDDMPTEFNSPAYAGRRPAKDAAVVARLRAAGATILGKSVTTEFAFRHPGQTVNPWNSAHTPGGSSSGSAAAVGAGIVSLALGTQTQGSVIRPAAYCGVVGFKPTYGAISRAGVLPLAWSLDHVGTFTRNVADAAYVFALLAGDDLNDPHASHVPSADAAPSARRIGVPRTQVGGLLDTAQQAALDALASTLSLDGAEIVPVDLPAEIFATPALALTLMGVEAAITHGDVYRRSPSLISAPMRALIEEGLRTSAADYAKTRALQGRMAHRFHAWIQKEMTLDAVLVAPANGEAPRGLDSTGDASFCAPWSFLGVPAVTVPVSFGPAGLPLGAQLVGAAGSDAALLNLAAWSKARRQWPAAVAAFQPPST